MGKENSLKETIIYLRESIRNFHQTGSVFATSQWAAKELSKPVYERKEPMNILELGAGTGSVTLQIIQNLIPGDRLDICEINSDFMGILKKKLATNEDFIKHRDKITFYECPVQELPETIKYDAFIASLPFLNFDIQTIEEIFDKIERLANPEALMTYYEYIGLRRIGKLFSPPQRRDRMKQIDDYFKERHESSKVEHIRVWLNMLPIKIHTLKLDKVA